MKTYPMADGRCARHLSWMLQPGCYRAKASDAQLEVRGQIEGRRQRALLLRVRCCAGAQGTVSILARTDDHGVNPIKRHCQHQPENGGEEEAAQDFAYGMGMEKAAIGISVGKAFGSGL